jgi:hypothetical protein
VLNPIKGERKKRFEVDKKHLGVVDLMFGNEEEGGGWGRQS